jgi:hypothetical protein
VWIPSETVLLIPRPNNPQSIKITNEPSIGLFVEKSPDDEDFCIIVSDGREWATNKKYIKHLRKQHVS